jgi:N-acetyl-anhydromuramyl-L-alanine amidase AmpD
MLNPLSLVEKLPVSNRKIKMLVIHCADTTAKMDIGAAEIRRWHTDPKPKGNGWKDIGYHFVIRRNGMVELGRDTDGDGDIFEEIGSHVAGYNTNSLGLCMVGGRGVDGRAENNFTEEQWRSLERLCRFIKARYPQITIHGHREFNYGKQCPAFDVQDWLRKTKI